MKFPITRESLQAFDFVKEQQEKIEEELQIRYNQILEGVCKEFQRTMQLNSKEKKFVWRNMHLLRTLHIEEVYRVGSSYKGAVDSYKGAVDIDSYLPQFIEKLKGIFIGCDIIIDPLKTYLIIDWS